MANFLLNQAQEKVLTVLPLSERSIHTLFQNPNFYGVLFFTKAEGILVVDEQEIEVRENYILFYYPYQNLTLKGNYEGVFMQFHPDFFCIDIHAKDIGCQGVLFNNFFNDFLLKCSESEFLKLLRLEEAIERELESREMGQMEMVACQLKALLIASVRMKNRQMQDELPQKESLHSEIERLIENNFMTESSPEFYLKTLNVSATTFNRLCKKYFQNSFITILNLKRIAVAKNRLFLTNHSVKEIAYDVGFSDPLYFSRVFKKHANVTPSEFRMQLKSNRLV